MSNILKLFLDQPANLLDQLYKNKSDLKPIHLAVAAEQKLRDVCLYLIEFVHDSACSDSAKEYLCTLVEHSITINNNMKFWKLNGQYHRLDGPACEWNNGDKTWWINGQRHREDGPAIERANGTKEWWLDGKRQQSKAHWLIEKFEMNKISGPSLIMASGTCSYVEGSSLKTTFEQLIKQYGRETFFSTLSEI